MTTSRYKDILQKAQELIAKADELRALLLITPSNREIEAQAKHIFDSLMYTLKAASRQIEMSWDGMIVGGLTYLSCTLSPACTHLEQHIKEIDMFGICGCGQCEDEEETVN